MAHRLRVAGALEPDVRLTLTAGRRHHLHPADVVLVLHDYHHAVRLYGPAPGFGPFVVARLDEGLRGPALARAIKAKRGVAWGVRGHGGVGHGPGDVRHGGKHAVVSTGKSKGKPVKYVSRGGSSSKGGHGHGSSGKGKGHDKGRK